MSHVIGTEQDLVERVKPHKDIPLTRFLVDAKTDNNKGILLVRAINDNELDQLLRDGSESFHFSRGTEYETDYGRMVRMFAKRRNGTVIVYPLQRRDGGTFCDEDRRFDIYGWAYCINSFTASVEVYNFKGLGWQELRDLKKKGTVIDQIAKEVFVEAYAKK